MMEVCLLGFSVLFVCLFFDCLFMAGYCFFLIFLILLSCLTVVGDFGISVGLSYCSVDFLSLCMLLLTCWSLGVCYMFNLSWTSKVLFGVLFFSLFQSFICSSFLMFYIYFEVATVVLYILIVGGGFPGSFEAGLYMFIYTVGASLPGLYNILLIGEMNGSVLFEYFYYYSGTLGAGWGFLVLMFLVKVPLFFFHSWLPKAHVEAPVYGSMVLASVMLKLGVYGLMRFIMCFGLDGQWVDLMLGWSLAGVVYLSAVCLIIQDLKVLVAYSSVVHMGIALSALLSGSYLGYVGCLLMMLSHGICSSGLFYMVGLMQSRSGSRLVYLNKGFMGSYSVFSFLWLFMLMDNIGAPPSMNMLGEMMSVGGILLGSGGSIFAYFSLISMLFMMSCVSLLIYYYMFGGQQMSGIPIFVGDYFIITIHLIPLNLFIVYFFVLF